MIDFDPYAAFWEEDHPLYSIRLHRTGWDRKLAVLRAGGPNICFGKGGGDVPTPDPGIAQAAQKEGQIGQDWLDFAKDQFNIGNARQSDIDALTKQITQGQLDTATQGQQWANQDRQRYQDVFQPLQDQFIQTAQNYASPGKQQEAAAEAGADQQQAAKNANAANTRQMASMGINPNSGRFQGITSAQNTANALGVASAENSARQNVRDTGLQLQQTAANMGNGLPGSAISNAGLGLNAGNAAEGNINAANSSWLGNIGIMGQGYGGAMQGYNNQGNMLNSQYGNQIQGYNAQQQANGSMWGGIGSLVGTGIGAWGAF
jgi:hypothetical protein